MKIKITEQQLKKLQLIAENEDAIAKFDQYCKAKVQEINKIYSKLTFITVEEIVSLTVDIEKIQKIVDDIDSDVLQAESRISDFYDKADIEEPLSIHDMSQPVFNKINAISLILQQLDKIQDYQKRVKITSNFSDVKPIEI